MIVITKTGSVPMRATATFVHCSRSYNTFLWPRVIKRITSSVVETGTRAASGTFIPFAVPSRISNVVSG